MTRKVVMNIIYKNICWKETKMYLGHYRILFIDDHKCYDECAGIIINLYRQSEYNVDYNNYKCNKFEYREKIQDELQKLYKGKNKDKIKIIINK